MKHKEEEATFTLLDSKCLFCGSWVKFSLLEANTLIFLLLLLSTWTSDIEITKSFTPRKLKGFNLVWGTHQSPTFSFKFAPIPRPCPSSSTYAHSCPPIAWHVRTHAHLCPPMLFKSRPCIQKLCNVYYLPTPSLGWIGQIKGRSLSLASARNASWLEYSLHPISLTPIWSWMQGVFLSFGILLAGLR